MIINKDGAYYRQHLPHYRSPGAIYHCRLSLNATEPHFRLTEDWMFEIVENAIFAGHKGECLVHAYVIMANHTHIAIQPLPKTDSLSAWCDYREYHPLEHILGKIKGRSARYINRRCCRIAALWQSESYDRIIRGAQDLENVIDYMHHNPVRWRLVDQPEQYRWSSLRTIYSGDDAFQGWLDLPNPLLNL